MQMQCGFLAGSDALTNPARTTRFRHLLLFTQVLVRSSSQCGLPYVTSWHKCAR